MDADMLPPYPIIQPHEILSAEAERALLIRVHADADEEARAELVRCNQRLVLGIARKHRGGSMGLADLVQEGNLGLLRAIDKFDIGRPGKFSTYAVWWIRQAITRAISNADSTIRIPVHLGESMGKLRAAEASLQHRSHDDFSAEDLTSMLGWSTEKLASVRSAQTICATLSLDAPLHHDPAEEERTLHMRLATTDLPIEEQIAQTDMQERISALLHHVSPRERLVLDLRYGLSGQIHTLDEVGTILGVTRERVRQIEHKAKETLRNLPAAQTLHETIYREG